MRYRVEDNTLIVEGKFDALSSGLKGGWKKVSSIFNHTVSDDFLDSDPVHYLETVAKRLGLKNYFGLLTSVPMEKLAIVKKDEVTAFVTAGVKNPNEVIGTINIILIIDAEPSDGAMVNTIITATEAKSHALLEMGYGFTGTNTDAAVVARTGGRYYEYAGPASDLGSKIWYCVKRGVLKSLSKW
ncbi:adenosylcobinamide amidohydrolase [Geoglobus acetivorans]|uniref:Adenosylcobinamide amidohydrolase n=1 Tax=Geoglobus acetivorans TaxID=565033 RepID=A0A0A7GFR9_GEOAI|nr:Adenosylcobinamide amidohydrolase [Geoglobus acetivorans]